MKKINTKVILYSVLTGVLISGCITGIGKVHYLAPNASQEVKVSQSNVVNRSFTSILKTGPGTMAKIQIPKATLEITHENLYFNGLMGLYVPIIPLSHIFGTEKKYLAITVIINESSINSLRLDISKSVIILPDGKNIAPTEYLTYRPFQMEYHSPEEILERDYDKWENRYPIWVNIIYPVTPEEVESFQLVWVGFIVDSEKVVLPEIKFQKASGWAFTIYDYGSAEGI